MIRNLGLHDPDFEGVNLSYTSRFRYSKFHLYGEISRRKLSTRAIFVDSEFWTRIRYENSSRNVSYTVTFRDSSRARVKRVSHLRNRDSRETGRNMPYTGIFRLQNEVSLHFFWRSFTQLREASKFWIPEFWNIDELKQNWNNNGAQFRQLCSLLDFSKFQNESFERTLEIECRKGKSAPPVLNNFGSTTCSFAVKSQFRFRKKSEIDFRRNHTVKSQ